MIKKNTNITLRPYKTYKNDSSKNVPIGYGEDAEGTFLKFQVMDVNGGKDGKSNTGFAYVNVYTDLPLKVNDMVTVEEIVTFQVKRNVVIIGIRIKQKVAGVLESQTYQNEFIENGFDF